jgi:outer membrane protein assembly factor BamB
LRHTRIVQGHLLLETIDRSSKDSSMLVNRGVALSWLIAASAITAFADDWPHWRGPRRNGTTAETSRWNEKGWPPKERWRVNVGEGASSPIIVKDRLYVMGWSGGRDHLRCLDAATGKQIWVVSYASPQYGRFATGDEGLYSGVTSTPDFDAESGLLFTLGSDGHLKAWDTRRPGQQVWGFNLYDRFDVPRRIKPTRNGHRDYGYTSSPLIAGPVVIVEVGAAAGTLMALDKRTGELRWTSRANDPAGHTAGPVPITVGDMPCIAVLHLNGLLVIRADAGHEGETVAEVSWPTDFANNIASPAVSGADLLITSGYNQSKMRRLRISSTGAETLWEQAHVSQICTPVIHKDRVFWSWERLTCVDWENGKAVWKGDSLGEAGSCIITADDRLIAWTGRGTLTLAETTARSPSGYVRLFQEQVLGPTDAWPHIALAGGRLYCKDRSGELVCLALGEGK